VAQATSGDSLGVAAVSQVGAGSIAARVVDPTRITGATYQVQFFNPTGENGAVDASVTTYRIVNMSTGEIVLDGQAYYDQNGTGLPSGQNVAVVDGFTFDIIAPTPDFRTFVVTQNASGVLPTPEYAALAVAPADFPNIPDFTVNLIQPTEGQQVGPAEWVIEQGSLPANATYATFFERVTRDGANFPQIRSNDYEWRFTGGTSIAYRGFTPGGGFVTVPFELWDIGVAPDASDDVRLIPLMNPQGTPDAFDLQRREAGPPVVPAVDHAVSSGPNDPFTDWIYWYRPIDGSPGQAGYNAYANGGTPNTDLIGDEIFARMVLVNVNGGVVTS
jgi:hypothetical protein